MAYEDFLFFSSGWKDVLYGRIGEHVRRNQVPFPFLFEEFDSGYVPPGRLVDVLMSLDLPLPTKYLLRLVQTLPASMEGKIELAPLLNEVGGV